MVLGDVGLYTGFVPDKNRKEILAFKGLRAEDKYVTEIINSESQVIGHVSENELLSNYAKKVVKEDSNYTFVQFSDGSINVKGGTAKWGEFAKVRKYSDNSLMICAPVKDMDMSGMTIEEGYQIKTIPVEDPVVLKRIVGGYLILTAWGPEASDPHVVNEINN